MVQTDGCRGAEQVLRSDLSARFIKDSPIFVWLASRSFGATHEGDVVAANLKTPDFSPLLEVLVGTSQDDGSKRCNTAIG